MNFNPLEFQKRFTLLPREGRVGDRRPPGPRVSRIRAPSDRGGGKAPNARSEHRPVPFDWRQVWRRMPAALVENPFRNVGARIGRVKRWHAATDQAERWLAYGLVEAEKGFRRIKGHRDIGLLLQAMEWPPDAWPRGRERSDLPKPPGGDLH